MTNTFQSFMISDKAKEIIKKIVTIYHPQLNIDTLKIHVSLQYDWVMIHAQKVSLGLEVNNGFLGAGFKLKDFENCLINKKFEFKSWRFVDDSKYMEYKQYKELAGKDIDTHLSLNAYFSLENKERKEVHDLLVKENVPLPTAKEMYKYYYKD